MGSIWRVTRYLFRYRGLFYLTLGLAIGSTLFLMAVPQVIRIVLDDIIAPGRPDLLLWGVAALAGCYLAREALNSLRIRINNILEQKVLFDLRRDLHRKLLELPVAYFDRRKSGEIASRVIEDVQNVERVVLDGTEQGTVAILTVLGIAVILFIQQPALAALVILPLPLVIWLSLLHFRATRRNWSRVRESAGQLNALLVEDIQGNRLISSFALRDREAGRFDHEANELRWRTLKAMFRWSYHGPATSFIMSLGSVAVVGFGGYLLMQADPSDPRAFGFGDFVAFFAYCALLYQPVNQLNGLNHLFAAGKASAERVFEILDHPVEVTSPPDPKPFPEGLLEVRYRGVTFSYAERAAVIHSLDLTLPAGQVTAIVGHTGAGKSTLANLLLRYYDVTAGAVLINGIDVRHLDLDALRQHIGFVAQDPFLFDGTVAENLLLAREDAREADLWEALEAACATEFVQALPEGLDTLIGERGIRLSMGEKQRLTIARVILRNPPLVILDEATSSVDTLTEARIQTAIDNLVRRRTTLVIAHRLSTVSRADQIVVLDHGTIRERGTHADLLKQGGLYARLWKTQTDLIPDLDEDLLLPDQRS
ncbi:MAG: ABC transporter ATP-binding protein [Puniceicoccaceae bacterium]|nr:MAG: ABC transporter ATP-binding protein [Puniceicoccaceae bacterium]